MKVLVICTGNSCRSQMAEGFLKSFDPKLEVFSAGTHPASKVNPNAVKVMKEIGIDISNQVPDLVDKYIDEEWDYVITVCDSAKETCPVFSGKVKNRLHIGFEDPFSANGSEEDILAVYRKVRNAINDQFYSFYLNNIPELNT
jgi:arsenate reductase (thioredoxin)